MKILNIFFILITKEKKSGEALKNQGTPNRSELIAMANGKASITVIANPKQKKVVVMVMNQDFKGTYLEIPTQ